MAPTKIGPVMYGRFASIQWGKWMSATEPCSEPSRSASVVSGHLKPLSAYTIASPVTTAPAIAARRSDRFEMLEYAK